ncbi:hypothetical protein [Sphingomonas sp. 32-62-10]|uniref:hypothetical protein n=1 Tax=Sphingomonas sp. 32-62-10 TaxID=1970436 RepID=UPI0035A88265
MIGHEPFCGSEHQPGSAGNQRSQQWVKERPRHFRFVSRESERVAGRTMHRCRLGFRASFDIYLDKDAIACRIGRDFQSILFGIEFIFFVTACRVPPLFERLAQLNNALEKVGIVGIDAIFGIAANLDCSKVRLHRSRRERNSFDDIGRFTAKQFGGDAIRQSKPQRHGRCQIIRTDRAWTFTTIGRANRIGRPHRENVRGQLDRPVHARRNGSAPYRQRIGDDEFPKPHKGANGRIHGQEIAEYDLANFPANADFGTTAEIASHDLGEHVARKIRLAFPPRLDAHFAQIAFSNACLAIDFLGDRAGQAEPRHPRHDFAVAFPCRLHITNSIARHVIGDRPVEILKIELGIFDLQKLRKAGERKATGKQRTGERFYVDEMTAPDWSWQFAPSLPATVSLLHRRCERNRGRALRHMFDANGRVNLLGCQLERKISLHSRWNVRNRIASRTVTYRQP